MNINVHVLHGVSSVGLQIFDHLYAYDQSLARDNSHLSTLNFTFIDSPQVGSYNILFTHMPSVSIIECSVDYDLVLLDNGDEPLEVSTHELYTTLTKVDHSQLLCNSFLTKDHILYSKILTTACDHDKFKSYYGSPFYPQYYYNIKTCNPRKNLIFINGQNRSWRHHSIICIQQHVPDIKILNNLSLVIYETNDCMFETISDSEYREWVNNKYEISRNHGYLYYDNALACGIDKKFGKLPPGYFILDEYFNYHCVIFPESSWINNQLSITEKILKYCIARSFPLPISGAFVNQLYKDIGIYTAWNLLPDELQTYDSVLDHRSRTDQMSLAVAWLNNHPNVYQSQQAQKYLDLNYLNFFTKKFSLDTTKKLWNLITR